MQSSGEESYADRDVMTTDLRRQLERALNTLPERQRDIVKLFFGWDNNGL